jgi:tetratricopeptide (TPR) repeat protein
MPSREANNIAHVSQTDHRIVRSAGDAATSNGTANDSDAALRIFETADDQLSEQEQARTLGLAAWLHISRKGQTPPLSLSTWYEQSLAVWPDDEDVLTTYASLLMEYNQPDRAFELYHAALQRTRAREAALEGCLKSCYLQARWNDALRFADQLLKIKPDPANVHAMRADTLWNLKRPEEAITAARSALRFNPALLTIREWLIDKLHRNGQVEAAEREKEVLLRLRTATPPPANDGLPSIP